MKKRINVNMLEPDAYQSMFSIEKYLISIDLEPSSILKEWEGTKLKWEIQTKRQTKE